VRSVASISLLYICIIIMRASCSDMTSSTKYVPVLLSAYFSCIRTNKVGPKSH
jgi:hypothetical protein